MSKQERQAARVAGRTKEKRERIKPRGYRGSYQEKKEQIHFYIGLLFNAALAIWIVEVLK